MGLSSSEDRMIVAGVVLAWYRTVTDRRSDGQTVGQTESIIAKTALCIASYADALSKTCDATFQKCSCATLALIVGKRTFRHFDSSSINLDYRCLHYLVYCSYTFHMKFVLFVYINIIILTITDQTNSYVWIQYLQLTPYFIMKN